MKKLAMAWLGALSLAVVPSLAGTIQYYSKAVCQNDAKHVYQCCNYVQGKPATAKWSSNWDRRDDPCSSLQPGIFQYINARNCTESSAVFASEPTQTVAKQCGSKAIFSP